MASGTINRTHLIEKIYTVTPTANGNVSPFSYYAELDISNDIAKYGEVKSIYIYGVGSADPVICSLNTTRRRVWMYAKTAETKSIVVNY